MRLQIPIEGLLKFLVVEKLTRRPLAAGKRPPPSGSRTVADADDLEYPSLANILNYHWFLNEPDQKKSAVPSDRLRLENADLSWDAQKSSPNTQNDVILSDVSIDFPPGALSIITGGTGSGKSLLLASMLDETSIRCGRLFRPPVCATANKSKFQITSGGTALVSQPPWIENRTIFENIIFGSAYDEARYREVLAACALNQDLSALPKGDQTIAGLSGAILSGGQKWRVALARAFYSTAEIILLDDVLSAVDTRVAKRIFEQMLTGK
ncbi:multidrug resistance-associated protein 1 [Cordyceps javanica]|uniref:Multidrug resistance-associated protein 1 n=1 Tax=Cordyceps javanica TaxID=43265 RepID=A0A545V6N8_9HYPO|nr:multidrug resistance-associated protein 1 [Cordyceps javanica]